MRIIKLSSKDQDMKTDEMVEYFFERKLKETEPEGQFLLTKGRIAKCGISLGEVLVFSYKGELKYLALSKSMRMETIGPDRKEYPYFFCVDVETIVRAKGTLADLGIEFNFEKNIIRTQGWPTFKDSLGLKEKVWGLFELK